MPKSLLRPVTIVLSSLLLFISGCSDNEAALTPDQLKDLSAYAVGLNTTNRLDYYPLIQAQIPASHNPELHRNVLEIAMVLDTLAMKYMDQTGGIMKDGTLVNPGEAGEKGAQVYKELEIERRLKELLHKAKENSGPRDKDLMRITEFIVQDKFLNKSPYFDQQKLTATPLSVLSLQLLLFENKLCAELLTSLSENSK